MGIKGVSTMVTINNYTMHPYTASELGKLLGRERIGKNLHGKMSFQYFNRFSR
jgi:hypothetical protein